jgi:hypothetical protein
MRARHLLVPILLFAPLVACSSDDIVEALTGPTGLDVRGTYDVNGWFTATEVGTANSAVYRCSGSFAVNSQTGNVFSGTWSLFNEGDCPGELVGNFTGTVDNDDEGLVTVSILLPGRDAAVEAISGCQITGGDDEFVGSIDPVNGFVDVESIYTANCPTDGGMAAFEFSIVFEDD